MNTTFREMTFDFGEMLSRKITQEIKSEDVTGPNEKKQNVTIKFIKFILNLGDVIHITRMKKLA
jgi:hypothetical protein